jgi:hypothetical protein
LSTKFNDVYNEIRALCASVYSDRQELNNPYFVEDDSDLMFDSAYAVGIAGAENSNRTLCANATILRRFNVILTNRYMAPSRDIPTRVTAEKKIINAQLDLVKYLEQNPTTANTIRIKWVSDNGLEFLQGDRFGFFVLVNTIECEYFESF